MKKCKEALQTIGRDHREGKKKEHDKKIFSIKVLWNMYENTRMKPLSMCVQLVYATQYVK